MASKRKYESEFSDDLPAAKSQKLNRTFKDSWKNVFSCLFHVYICVICDCVCVLKYAIYLIWPRQFSFGPDSSHLAHVFLIWLIPWPEQKMSQRGP